MVFKRLKSFFMQGYPRDGDTVLIDALGVIGRVKGDPVTEGSGRYIVVWVIIETRAGTRRVTSTALKPGGLGRADWHL
jgi:hypothetical protein